MIVRVVRPDYFGYAAAFLFNALLPRKGLTDDRLLDQLSRFVVEVRFPSYHFQSVILTLVQRWLR